MLSRWLLAGVLACAVVGSVSCGPGIDLTKLKVTDVFSGWYDFGVVDGLNKLVPSISFRLQNTGDVPVTEVQLTVSFWQDGADGEWDSKEVAGVGGTTLAPGSSTDPILVRAGAGYTLAQPRAELFTHRLFKDATAKIFAKRNGKIVPIGQFKLDRRIIPHATTAGAE
ncbi:MAG TPA: hypothetical protein VHD57_15770 [Vicinamibacterales bacterium]|jgi:hypothetical protein|nr:hypothetical protein [Vicinamibacterales bacterium]